MPFVKTIFAAAVLVLCASGAMAQTVPGLGVGVERSPGGSYHKRVCSAKPAEGAAACHAEVETDARGTPRDFRFSPRSATVLGALPYYARDLWSAYYGTTARPPLPAGTVAPTTTPTIAIVAAYGYSRARLDLVEYRRMNGLPPLCASTVATNCVRFQKLNQAGVEGSYPIANASWALEQAIDIQMVSAMCPWCNILLVEANSNTYANLGASVLMASRRPGVIAISNSYGGAEKGSLSSAAYFSPSNTVVNGYQGKLKSSIAVLASSGDSGYAGGNAFPAVAPFVLAVGGTRLSLVSGRWTERAWSRAGSACSSYYSQMAWQKAVLPSRACSGRVVADVSAVADPETGVAVYYNGKILRAGGTSVSAPLIAGIMGQRNRPISLTLVTGAGSVATVQYPAPGGANIATSYGKNLYANRGALRDVTTGSNGFCPSYLCRAGVGFDGPTGLGTPKTITNLSPF